MLYAALQWASENSAGEKAAAHLIIALHFELNKALLCLGTLVPS